MKAPEDKRPSTIKTWLGTGSINIFGLPFAGKDTHGRELAEIFGATLIGGGDILRNSTIPPHVKKIIDQGLLAPTDDYIDIVLPYLSRPEIADTPFILSSVGRWHGEEDGVMQAADESGHPVRAVVYLSIDNSEAVRRFNRSQDLGDRESRDDDAEHLLETRIEEFRQKTIPVIDYYRKRDLLIEIDGRPPKPIVLDAILDALYARATK